jgi:hypothetical protein
VRKVLTALLAATGDDEMRPLADSGWLESPSPNELRKLYAQYGERFDAALPEVEAILGPPVRTWPADKKWFEDWYPEALRAVAWVS